jgi:hydroxymethylpyrimidine pyrophosphatase-like HAD family hydrolase
LAIKVIALDLDGTLLNSNVEISFDTEQVIKKVSTLGIKIVLATGRPLSGVFSYNQR